MKTSTITKTLGVLALLGSSASMAATVTIVASNLNPSIGENFTLTVTGDAQNTFAATMALAFNGTTVQFVSGVALSPWNVFTKNSLASQNPTVFDVESPAAVNLGGATYNVALLTFTAIANGAANIVIDDDGGNATGWFDADSADYIPNTYTQANVTVGQVPAPATLGLLATALGGLVLRRKRARAA